VHHISMSAETVTLPVSGMTCGGCARSVEKKLSSTAGVVRAKVDLDAATATVEFDPARTAVPALVAAVEQIGFSVPRPPQ
jgi:copper chaperone CopZ